MSQPDYIIPRDLTYESIGILYPSTKTEYRRPPSNNTTFTPGVDINLVLNKMERSFANPATAVVNFEVAYVLTNAAGTLTAGDGVYILGSAYSHFSRQILKSTNGGVIESFENPSTLVNAIMNMTTSKSEKQAMINWGFGATNNETNAAIFIPAGELTAATSRIVYRTYSLPIIGCLNASKMIPLFVSDMGLDLTVNAVNNFIISSDVDLSCTFTIQNVELVYDVLTVEDNGFRTIMAAAGGIMPIKTTSYKYGSSTLPSGAAAGNYDIVYAHSVRSLKKFIWWCSPQGNWELSYGGVNPNLTDWCLSINSTTHPQQRVKSSRVSEVYYQNSKAFGSVYSTNHSGSYDRNSFAKCSLAGTATANREYAVYAGALGSAGAPTLGNLQGKDMTSAMSNKFYQALDLEKINQLSNGTYSGISSRGSTNTFILNVGVGLAAVTHNIHFFTEYDVLIYFDSVSGMITVSD